LEEISLPLANDQTLDEIPLESINNAQEEENDGMDLDSPDNTSLKDIEFDYSLLPNEYRKNDSPEQALQFESNLKELNSEMERLAPNLRILSK
jgi:hypothetical protein